MLAGSQTKLEKRKRQWTLYTRANYLIEKKEERNKRDEEGKESGNIFLVDFKDFSI